MVEDLSFIARVKKHTKYTWKILIPKSIINKLDKRKKIKVTFSQKDLK